MEDETYFWNVSRCIRLNPVRAGLVDHPADRPWSSYPGYARRRQRVAWISYDTLLSAWQGEFGGSDAARAYCGFVEQGIENPPVSRSNTHCTGGFSAVRSLPIVCGASG